MVDLTVIGHCTNGGLCSGRVFQYCKGVISQAVVWRKCSIV